MDSLVLWPFTFPKAISLCLMMASGTIMYECIFIREECCCQTKVGRGRVFSKWVNFHFPSKLLVARQIAFHGEAHIFKALQQVSLKASCSISAINKRSSQHLRHSVWKITKNVPLVGHRVARIRFESFEPL